VRNLESRNLRTRRAYFFLWTGYVSAAGGRQGTDNGGDLGAVAAAELGQDVTHVRVDGAVGDEQPLGDLPVRQTPCDQLRDLTLTRSEQQILLR
jgi:hypothetical protein